MQVHPGKKIQIELKDRSWTQRQFAFLLGKKVSEVNELIKGKRNITVQWDILLSHVLGTKRKYWLELQNEYDYSLIESDFDLSKLPKTEQNIEISDKKDHKISEQENKSEISSEKTKEASQTILKEEKKEAKQAYDHFHDSNKEHKIYKDVDISKEQEKHPKQDSKKDLKIKKIHEKNISSKQDLSSLDSGRKKNPPVLRTTPPFPKEDKNLESEEKKDKNNWQKIYNKDDKFDSYFPSKEKKEKHRSTSINVDKKLNNKILDSGRKTITPESLKKSEEKKDDHKDHHKHKENIFRNF